jgi:hypothetical protein
MSLFNALNEAVRNGWAVDFGSVALDGTNPTSVITNVMIQGAIVVMNTKTALGDATHAVTWFVETATGNQLDIYGWMPVSGTDPTHVASTGTETVTWMAWGVPTSAS